jgi:hypothetical protein
VRADRAGTRPGRPPRNARTAHRQDPNSITDCQSCATAYLAAGRRWRQGLKRSRSNCLQALVCRHVSCPCEFNGDTRSRKCGYIDKRVHAAVVHCSSTKRLNAQFRSDTRSRKWYAAAGGTETAHTRIPVKRRILGRQAVQDGILLTKCEASTMKYLSDVHRVIGHPSWQGSTQICTRSPSRWHDRFRLRMDTVRKLGHGTFTFRHNVSTHTRRTLYECERARPAQVVSSWLGWPPLAQATSVRARCVSGTRPKAWHERAVAAPCTLPESGMPTPALPQRVIPRRAHCCWSPP